MMKRITGLVVVLALSGCASAPWSKSKVEGKTPEERVASVKKSVEKNPEDTKTLKDLRVTQEKAVSELLPAAEQARSASKWDEAVALYDRVLALEPNNARAISGKAGIEREQQHAKLLEEAKGLMEKKSNDAALRKVRDVLLENPDNVEAIKLQQEIRSMRVSARGEPPKLKPPFDKPVTLELRDANIKMVFEALSRVTGINFILDKDVKPDTKATVFIKKAPVEDAIEMVLGTNGLQKKALTETSAMVFPATPQKLKDYQDLVIRNFYLTNATAKNVAALLKTMLKTKDLYVDDRLNMIVIRDTPEVIRVAEKLIAANDMADPEVMLDVEVFQISKTLVQQLGISYPNGVTVTASTLKALKNITQGSVNIPSSSGTYGVDFINTESDLKVLSNPRIRVRNNEKAKIQVGSKIPVFTSSATGSTGSTISYSTSYVDVGLKLELEPRVGLDDYVTIKVGLEVTDKGTTRSSGGTTPSTAFDINTRNANTVLRLKNGETQVLAGLIQDNDAKEPQGNKIPGLGDIPVLGHLFSNDKTTQDKQEIVLVITPHVVNNINRPDAEVAEYWSGTDSTISDEPKIGASAGNGGRVPSRFERPPVSEAVAVPEPEQVVQEPVVETPKPGEAPPPVINPASPPAAP